MRRLPPLNSLRSFEAAARHQSFNKAANELYVTPSAVSHQIKGLEDFLGLKLFRREKRSVILTAAGGKYLSGIQHALDEIDSVTRRLMASPNVGAVNLSAVPAFLTRWLVPRITQFQQQHPDLELRISANPGSIDFYNSDTDMAIYFGSGEWQDVEMHYLRNVVVVPVCSPALLQQKPTINTPEAMLNHSLIHVTSRTNEWPDLLRQTGIEYPRNQKGLSFSSTSLALGAAMEGVGIALADKMLVEREVEYGQLVVPFDLQLDTHKGFYLVYQKERKLTYAMQAFKDWLLTEINKHEDATPA